MESENTSIGGRQSMFPIATIFMLLENDDWLSPFFTYFQHTFLFVISKRRSVILEKEGWEDYLLVYQS